jgi:hypothetical protein
LADKTKRPGPRVSLRDEPQPDPAALEMVERVESSGVRLREETVEEFTARLEAWRADPSLPEPHEDDLVEDRSECDLEGMSLDEYAAMLQAGLPGLVHGYSPSQPPDAPTPPRHDPRELRVALRQGRPPTLAPAYLKCLQRRIRLGMALHRREDFPRLPPDWKLE